MTAISVCEVGMRDGLQSETVFVPTATKVELLNRLTATGLGRIQVTSFVHPKLVPQLADAQDVMAQITRRPSVVYSALVPNVRGAERALAANVDELDVALSASETHNLANMNMTVDESMVELEAIARLAREAKKPFLAGIGTAFGCPYECEVPLSRVEALMRRMVDLGCRALLLADTTGMANPEQIRRVLEVLLPRFSGTPVTLHVHNTRGLGLANVLAGISAGIRHVDASIGGLGGCSFAPDASGNVCSEDLVNCLEAMGYSTGVDLDALTSVSRQMEQQLGRRLPGQLLRSGRAAVRHPVPDSVLRRIEARRGTASR